MTPQRDIPVTVTDAAGNPVADAKVVFSNLGMKPAPSATTDSQGKATLHIPEGGCLHSIVAVKEGIGFDYFVFWLPNQVCSDPYRLPEDFSGELTFVLNGTRTVTIHVQDEAQRPLPNVFVYPWLIGKPLKGDKLNLSFFRELHRHTDAEGSATFPFVPVDALSRIMFLTQCCGYTAPQRAIFDPAMPVSAFTVTLVRRITVAGRVVDENGELVANATVDVAGAGYQHDSFRWKRVQTFEDGTFKIDVNPNQLYAFVARNDHAISEAVPRVIRELPPEEPIEIRLGKPHRVFGKVTADANREPVADQRISLVFCDGRLYEQVPVNQRLPVPPRPHLLGPAIFQEATTDAEGRFEFYTCRGHHYVESFVGGVNCCEHFDVPDEAEQEIVLHKGSATAP